jgi:hypothetical protein
MYAICPLCWLQGANKKVIEIRRERLNEHVPNVNCYISRNGFALAFLLYLPDHFYFE